MKQFAIIFGLFLCAIPASAQGTIYYISYSTGSNSNNGLTKATAWKSMPYMQTVAGCAGAAPSYSHVAGDTFIFKMGDSWPNACFDMVIQAGGLNGLNTDTYTFDPTWGTSTGTTGNLGQVVGAYQFNAGGSVISGADSINDFIYDNGNNYITFNGMELTGMFWNAAAPGSFGNVQMFQLQRSHHVVASNVWAHNWTYSNGTSLNSDALIVMVGNGGGTGATPYSVGTELTGSVVDGTVSGSNSGAAIFAIQYCDNNIIKNVTNGCLLNANGHAYANEIGPINASFQTSNHENCIETIDMVGSNGGTPGASTVLIYNNVMHDCTAAGILTQGAAPNAGWELDYLWNNVIYVGGTPVVPFKFDSVSTANSSSEVHSWNNTIVGGSANFCINTVNRGNGNFGTLDLQNNHCISDSGFDSLGITGTTLIVNNNVTQSVATATGQGYNSGQVYAYSPTSASNSTVVAGINLSTTATGIFSTLANDTAYGGIRPTTVRATPTGAWDVGAYTWLLPAAYGVQSCNSSGSFGSVTTANCFFSSTVTAGNIYLGKVNVNDATTTFVSGQIGSCATLSQVAGSPFRNINGTSDIVVIGQINISGTCGTPTVTLSANASGTVVGREYTGLAPIASVIDCVTAAASGNGTALASNACTTATSAGSQGSSMTASVSGQWVSEMVALKFNTEPQDILVGLGGTLGNLSTFTAGGIFLMETQQNSTARGASALEDAIVGTPDPVLAPQNPAIISGAMDTFSCTAYCGSAGTFSLISGTGSINSSTGVYTASGSIVAQQSVAGLQLLPNNHIFNTNISALPARSDSATLIAGAGTSPFNYFWSIPFNLINSSTPSTNLLAQYTPQNNGSYQVPQFPNALIQDGWYDSLLGNFNADHHMINVRTDTGVVNELYQFYNVGLNSGCLTCNTQSMVKYTVNDYTLPPVSTNAAGTMDLPIIVRGQEIETACSTGGSINHAGWMTLSNSFLHNAYLWPGTTSSNAGSGANYYGELIRLKSTFNISGFSACAQVLLTQLKNYGMILADGGANWSFQVEFTNVPTYVWTALQSITAANIAPSNFEVVDVSSLEVSPTSGVTTLNRENVCYVRTSDSRTGCTDIVLQGVAVNMQDNQLFIMAGTPIQQLVAFISGNSNTSLTWTMSPTLGTLNSSTGQYTAPATQATMASTTITATSVANSAVSSQMTVTICPQTGCYFLPGRGTNYTDSHSNVWTGSIGIGMANIPNLLGCCQTDPLFPVITDAALFNTHLQSSLTYGDYRMDSIRAPAGVYTLTYNDDTLNTTPGTNTKYFWLQGLNVATVDEATVAGGMNLPYTFTQNVTVGSDNKLSFLNVNIGGQPGNQGGGIASLSLVQFSNVLRGVGIGSNVKLGTNTGIQ